MLVRKKISLGFVIVGFILLLSSLIAIFEFYTMKNTVSKIVVNDINDINSTNILTEIAEKYNNVIITALQDSLTTVEEKVQAIKHDKLFFQTLDSIRQNLDYQLDKYLIRDNASSLSNLVDSVRYTYFAHIYHIAQLPKMVGKNSFNGHDWYMQTFYPNHTQLIEHIKVLKDSAHDSFILHSNSLNEGFRRSLMPCIVAVVIGIILLFLFNYFLNFYFMDPLDKICKGIKSYLVTKRSYDYNLQSNDEMQELNDNIRELITENRRFIKESQK